jgi:hypothetical protein
VLVTRRGDAATASPCPGSLGPSPGSPGHRADSGSHRARDVAFPRDSVSRECLDTRPPARRRASHARAG